MANIQIKDLTALEAEIDDGASIPIQQGEEEPAKKMTPAQLAEKVLIIPENPDNTTIPLRLAFVDPETGKIMYYSKTMFISDSGEDDFEGLNFGDYNWINNMGMFGVYGVGMYTADASSRVDVTEDYVNIEGPYIRLNSPVKADEINEDTSGAGVTIEGVLIKDGVVTGSFADEGADPYFREYNLLIKEPSATNGTNSLNLGTSGFYNGFRQIGGTFAGGEFAEFDEIIAPSTGNYEIILMASKTSASGIVEIVVDGDVEATIDMYASSGSVERIQAVGSITLAAGAHTIKLRVNGKNASSSNYQIRYSGLALQRV